jgi:Glycosyl transferase family 2
VSGPPFGRPVPANRWDVLDGQWPDEPPRVSVVVVHFDQQRQLERTLAALAGQRYDTARLEVIVVDDGSPAAPRVGEGVTLLRQEDRGFRAGAARNLGARHARGDVLCFLDADTAPEPDYVRELSRLPALAPETVTVGRRRHLDLATGVELPAPRWLERAYAESGNLLRADPRSYRHVISAVLACSAWFFEEVGGFDETWGTYGGEDWEWAHRAWVAGAILAHVPAAVAWHDGPDWSGRESGVRQATKNQETLRLADAIPVPGSRGNAVRSRAVDVVVRLPETASAAAAFVCVDSVLAELGEALVVVPDAVAGTFAAEPRVVAASDPRVAEARVVVALPRLVRAGGASLRAAVERVGAEDLGSLTLTGEDDEPRALVTSRRAAARATRWGPEALFADARARAGGLEPIDAEPDLEAYLGGWG